MPNSANCKFQKLLNVVHLARNYGTLRFKDGIQKCFRLNYSPWESHNQHRLRIRPTFALFYTKFVISNFLALILYNVSPFPGHCLLVAPFI